MTNSDEDFMTIYPPVPSQDWQNNRLFDEVTALRAALAERETENKYLRKQIEDLTNRLNWFESKIIRQVLLKRVLSKKVFLIQT